MYMSFSPLVPPLPPPSLSLSLSVSLCLSLSLSPSLSLSLSLSVEYNLESAESDTLLLNLLDQVEEAALDEQNHMERSSNRYPALFGLYPLPGREDALENRTPALPPSEHEGIKLLVKISELR